MGRCLQQIVTAAFVAVAVLLPSNGALTAAPPKPNKPTAKPTRPHVKPHPPSKKTYRVQARAPLWRGMAVVSSASAAQAIKNRLVRQGWQAKIRHSKRSDRWAVSARLVHWRTRAVAHNPAAAYRIAYLLMAQGFQARIL
jgi:hypothetical protein